MIDLSDATDAPSRLSPEALRKWNQFFDIMKQFAQSYPTFGTDVTIKFCIGSGKGSNPAFTSYNAKENIISVTIEDWFIEMSSPGFIAGMVNHEIGVHTLTDVMMGDESIGYESDNNHKSVKIKISDDKSFTLAGLPADGRDTRQIDHVNAVKTEKRSEIKDDLSERAAYYLQTFLVMGDSIEKSSLSDPQKIAMQRDMLVSLLFDVGQIIATDDGGVAPMFGKASRPFKVMWAAKEIEDIMKWYWTTFLEPLQDHFSWLKKEEFQDVIENPAVSFMLLGKVNDYAMHRAAMVSTKTKLFSGVSASALLGAGGAWLLGLPLLSKALAGSGALAIGAAGYGAYFGWEKSDDKSD